MSFIERLFYLLGLSKKPGPRYYEIDDGLHISLHTLANYEGRSEQELLPDVLAAGFDQYQSSDKLSRIWESLSAREQQVTGLTCLGLTNRQIGAKLSLSPETIKTHIRHILSKFGVKSKNELRHILVRWDFSAYQ